MVQIIVTVKLIRVSTNVKALNAKYVLLLIESSGICVAEKVSIPYL